MRERSAGLRGLDASSRSRRARCRRAWGRRARWRRRRRLRTWSPRPPRRSRTCRGVTQSTYARRARPRRTGERDGVGRQKVCERREGGERQWAGLNSSSSAKNASLSAGVSLAKTIAVRQDGAGSSLKSLFRVPRCLCALGLDGIAGHQSRKVSVCSMRSSGSAASQVFVSGEDRGHEGRVGTSERSDHGYKDRRKGCLD